MMEAQDDQEDSYTIGHGFADLVPGAGPRRPLLRTRRWGEWEKISGGRKAALVVVHGLGEHSGRYEPLAQALTSRGILVFSFDHRGHGRSEGMRLFAESLDELVADIATVVDQVAQQLPEEMPLFVMGHSMGGLLSGVYGSRPICNPRIRGFISSGAAYEPGPDIGSIAIMAASTLASVSPTTRTQELDPAAISTIVEEQKRYINDPLNVREAATVGLSAILLQGIEELKRVNWPHPTLFYYGRQDTLVSQTGIEAFYERCSNSDKTLWVAENSRHEILWDVDAEVCKDKIAAWILERSKKE